jgi:hypothetical protein
MNAARLMASLSMVLTTDSEVRKGRLEHRIQTCRRL